MKTGKYHGFDRCFVKQNKVIGLRFTWRHLAYLQNNNNRTVEKYNNKVTLFKNKQIFISCTCVLHLFTKSCYFVLFIYFWNCVFKTNLADAFCLDVSSRITRFPPCTIKDRLSTSTKHVSIPTPIASII